MKCRHCKKILKNIFLDLNFTPPSNAYLNKNDLIKPEKYYPLKVYVCNKCWLVQTKDYIRARDLFTSKYAYVSSTSSSCSAKDYCNKIINEFNINSKNFVVEIASNDGYLLKFIKKNIPCLGIEPTDSTAIKAEKIGVPVLRKFLENI